MVAGADRVRLENAYLMRMAGRFSRRVRGYAKTHRIPVIDCPAGQRKHDRAEEYLANTTVTHGVFLVLVGRAQAPVWDVSARNDCCRRMRSAAPRHRHATKWRLCRVLIWVGVQAYNAPRSARG